jgi:ribosome recycling factor
MNFINESKFNEVIQNFKENISSIRTGRANPSLVEGLQVEAYGSNQKLQSLASVSAEDAKTLVVEPYDDNVTQAIESALHDADIGVNPVSDGSKIRLPLPDLTADRRKELINLVKDKAEEARIEIRQIRQDIKTEIEQAEADSEITEDKKYKEIENLDETVSEYNEEIEQIVEEKIEKIKQI